MWPLKLSARQRQGQLGEQRALAYLQQHGLTLLEANFRCKVGEIDLIMRDGAALVFVEVRQRTAGAPVKAGASITPAKMRRIVRAAQFYLQRLERLPACRIDVVAIDGETLAWLRDAIQA